MKEVNTMLFADIIQLIEQSRTWVATSVNAELTLLYWQVGKRIYEDVLNSQRADYGKQVGVFSETFIRPIWQGLV